ncbi:hypothetical protein CBS147353_10755 [Aspergillus niger]|nr:hypothetical protein CBS147353_10755 [Aspergillus niger]
MPDRLPNNDCILPHLDKMTCQFHPIRNHPMRPLAPALRPKTADNTMPFNTGVSAPPIPPRQKASAACRECKRIRCKVVALFLPTHTSLTLCVFDLDEDMRRKLSHKRKLNKLEEERHFLQLLVKTLRDSSDDKALQLLGLIRSQAPPSPITALHRK